MVFSKQKAPSMLVKGFSSETGTTYAPSGGGSPSVDNHIWIYGEITEDTIADKVSELREIDAQLAGERAARGLDIIDYPKVPIWLHIHTVGGDLLAALGFADQVKSVASPVFSKIEGLCASAGTIISCACDSRYITPNSFMMIHQFWSAMEGNYAQFKDEMQFQDSLYQTMLDFYTEHSSLSVDRVEEILKKDYWLSAKQALEEGFVDHIA